MPKSKGGRDVVPLHPICHRTIHASVTNAELALIADDVIALRLRPEVATFLRWISNKPPDFTAPTRARRPR